MMRRVTSTIQETENSIHFHISLLYHIIITFSFPLYKSIDDVTKFIKSQHSEPKKYSVTKIKLCSSMASFNFLKSSPLILALFLFSQFSMINGHYEDEGIPADLNERGLIVVKIWCLIIIFLATFGCGLIPYFFRSNSNFLVLGNQFAGGVFLAISMHFLADSADVMDDYTEGSSVIPFLFVLIGYVLTLFGESILFKIKSKKDAFVRVEEGIKTEESATDIISPILVNRAAIEVSILLILGLALHSVFEGITIGLAGKLNLFYILCS